MQIVILIPHKLAIGIDGGLLASTENLAAFSLVLLILLVDLVDPFTETLSAVVASTPHQLTAPDHGGARQGVEDDQPPLHPSVPSSQLIEPDSCAVAWSLQVTVETSKWAL